MYVNKVIKVGDSLAVVMPAQLRRSLQINKGDFVVVVLGYTNTIIINKIDLDTAKLILEKEIKHDN